MTRRTIFAIAAVSTLLTVVSCAKKDEYGADSTGTAAITDTSTGTAGTSNTGTPAPTMSDTTAAPTGTGTGTDTTKKGYSTGDTTTRK